MKIIPLLIKEFEQEAQTTRKFLKLVPRDKFVWKPHEKSTNMKNLAVHIAELPMWPAMILSTNELDFASSPYEPTSVSDADELINLFEKSFKKGKQALSDASEEDLKSEWTLRNGEQVLAEWTKYEAIRHSFSQTTHHRAQLGVYFRLLDIPVPASYGPSADDEAF